MHHHCLKFRSQNVQIFGYVYHNTNGPNHFSLCLRRTRRKKTKELRAGARTSWQKLWRVDRFFFRVWTWSRCQAELTEIVESGSRFSFFRVWNLEFAVSGKQKGSVREETDAVSSTKDMSVHNRHRKLLHRPSHQWHELEVRRERGASEAGVRLGRTIDCRAKLSWRYLQ